MSQTQSLFQPLQLGPITLKNRIGMSALTRNRSVPKYVPNSINVEYYKQRAAGGCGLIVTEGVLISPQGSEWPNAPGIWSQEQIDGWKRIVDVVHQEGSVIYAQLWHIGRAAHPDMPVQIESGEPTWGPSAISAKGGKFRTLPGAPGYTSPTEIEDPMKFVALFKQAAINTKEAGFDGVELHGANGYLVHEFLDNTSNLRTDSWGGSVENRSKFGLEALKALIEVWGADRVAVKVSPGGGYNDMGMPLQDTLDTFSYFIKEASALGLAYIVLVRAGAMDPTGRGTLHDVISSYAHLISSPTKVFSNAQFTPAEAAQFVSEGKVDGVFFGVPWIVYPDLAKRILYGKPLDNEPDTHTFYGHGGTEEQEKKGYTDYPAALYE